MSENFQNKVSDKMPWVFKGFGIRLPKIKFPSLKDKNLDIPTPSRNILLGVIYVFLFWLLMGGVYLIIAFVIESIVAGVIIFIGAIGFIIIYQSTKHMYNTSYAQKLIAVGVVMAVFSFTILQYIAIARKAKGE